MTAVSQPRPSSLRPSLSVVVSASTAADDRARVVLLLALLSVVVDVMRGSA